MLAAMVDFVVVAFFSIQLVSLRRILLFTSANVLEKSSHKYEREWRRQQIRAFARFWDQQNCNLSVFECFLFSVGNRNHDHDLWQIPRIFSSSFIWEDDIVSNECLSTLIKPQQRGRAMECNVMKHYWTTNNKYTRSIRSAALEW